MYQENLHFRFQKLFGKLSTKDSLLNGYWQELVQFYQEKHRAYHNLTHLENMFAVFDQHKTAFTLIDEPIFEWAVFYHDVIYDVSTNPKNELRSADLAVQRLDDLGISKNRQQRCHQLIVSTQKHQALLEEVDCKLLIDIDLAILGESSEAYFVYTQQIRKEYKQYPSFLYNKGRKKAMKQFLERSRIYQTDYFFERFEEMARRNILGEGLGVRD